MLVLRIRAGDPGAEAELVVRYRTSLVRLLERQTRDVALAEDLAHDALVVAIERLRRGDLKEAAALPAFLRSIATNLLLAEWRRRRRRRTDALGSGIDFEDAAPGALETMLAAEEREVLQRAIESLPAPRDREVLRRAYLEGEPRESIREALGLPEVLFNTVLHRARERLRKTIEKFFRMP